MNRRGQTAWIGAGLAVVLGLSVPRILVAQATVTLPNSALEAVFVEDPETSWNLQSLRVSADPQSTAIPLHNATADVPLWTLRIFDGTATPILVSPAAPGPGGTLLATATLVQDILVLTYTITYSSGPLASVQVTIMTGAFPGDVEILWWGGLTVTPAPGVPLSVELFEFPRLAIGAQGQDTSDKLYVPTFEGALVGNYTDPAFQIHSGKDAFDVVSGQISHQQWGVYHAESGPTWPGLQIAHGLSDSQLFFMGSRDSQGWSKSVRTASGFDAALNKRYLLWVASNYPVNNRVPVTTPTNYVTLDPLDFQGYLWSCGALPARSDWYDLAARYRRWATTSYWNYDGESPHLLRPLGSPLTTVSPKVRDSSLMLVYYAPVGPGGCGRDFTNVIVNDVKAFHRLFVTDIGMPADTAGIITFQYGHLLETGILRENMDKLVDFANPFQLTPHSNVSWRTEIAGLASLPGVKVCLYTAGELWDVATTSWLGNPPIAPYVQAPVTLSAGACPTAGPCLPPQPIGAPWPGLRYSYQMGESGASGNVFRYPGSCDGDIVVCPRSTQYYHDGFWTSIALYVDLLRQTLGTSVGPLVQGAYLDNMASPGTPLCQYRPLNPSDPEDVPHLHPGTGGGRWWSAGRRGLALATRDAIRQGVDPDFFLQSETPSEHWVGVLDMRGSYFHGSGAYFGSYETIATLVAPWFLSYPNPPTHDITAVPGFNTVYGDYLPSFDWLPETPDRVTHFNLPAPPTYPPNLLPSGPYPMHPGIPAWSGLCVYNNYAYTALGVQDPNLCPFADVPGMGTAAYFSYLHIGTVAESALPADQWKNLLWIAAAYSYIPNALSFHFKIQFTSHNFREVHPLYPYHLNPDTTIGGALVADSPPFRFQQRMHKVKGDWRDWYMIGPRLGQPAVEPSAHLDFVERLAPDMRDLSFASAHGRYGAAGDTIIVVSNWTPYPQTFTVHFDPADCGFPLVVPSTVVEHEPDIGLGAQPPQALAFQISPIPGRLAFTTSSIPPVSVRVYRLQ